MRTRLMYGKLVSHLDSKKFSIIVGARQTGKSTLLGQVREYCTEHAMKTVFLNMEHKDIRANLDASPENIFQYLPVTDEKVFVFIDEIQKLEDPSNFLKLLWDDYKDKVKIIATGSSAFYIDGKFNDSLAGRKKIFTLYTCSFEEYLYLSEQDGLLDEYRRIRQSESALSTMLPLLKSAFYKYMQFGGYPEVVVTEDENVKIDILKDLRDSYIKKDLDDAGIKDEEAFFKLFRMVASQSGSLVNASELAKMTRIKEETVSRYLTIMSKSFHIKLVKPFFRNIGKELVKMPMVYFLDPGMRHSLSGNFLPVYSNPDIGHVWENQVFRILADKYGIDELRFWRTTDKKEVDFVLPNLPEPLAYEVKENSNQAKESKYRTFMQAYPEFKFNFICLEPFDESMLRLI